jgi:pimeloyl-ACP methyl ester carboxylesterase
MPTFRTVLTVIACASFLAACDSKEDMPEPVSPGTGSGTAPVRGTLVQSPAPRTRAVTVNELLAITGLGVNGELLLDLAGNPTCGIDIHTLTYNTVGGVGEATTASAALMVPTGTDPICQGPRPIMLYAHGTTTERDYNIANIDDADNGEGVAIAAIFASQGYIVVAPNYTGYDSSPLTYHPYLNAEAQSKDMIDALAAARSALPTSFAPEVTDGGKVLITGYSQGGYVAMATHRSMQAAGLTVTASAPMSGPYALAAFGDMVFNGSVGDSSPVFLTMLITGFQRVYGNVYANATDVFGASFVSGIDTLLPNLTPRGTLYAEGRLPKDQLFSSTPPDPAYASVTPATTPPELAPIFALGFGANPLIVNSFRLAYLQDMQANPDGGLPNTTTGVPAAAPANTLRQAFKANDLRNWSPTVPVLLCAGDQDPTVFYSNTQLMQGYWISVGATGPVTVLDVDGPTTGERFDDLKTGFAVAKDGVAAAAVVGGASDGGSLAVAEAYHSQLVPPFCLKAVRSFFSDF